MKAVPESLRKWFVLHAVVDLVFAIPLFFYPEWFLRLMGWPYYDPVTARLVAAALFGIGLESYFGRHGSIDSFRSMLRLKIIWSLAATVGILWTMFALPEKPLIGWGLALVFGAFHGLWLYWRRRLSM